MGKAKPAKHTAAELAKKAHEATVNAGGGKAGLHDRKGGTAGHAKFQCPICKVQGPDLKTMEAHHESKHSCKFHSPDDTSHIAFIIYTVLLIAVRRWLCAAGHP